MNKKENLEIRSLLLDENIHTIIDALKIAAISEQLSEKEAGEYCARLARQLARLGGEA